MLSVVQAARAVTGSILIIAGLIAIPLPVFPGNSHRAPRRDHWLRLASERAESVAEGEGEDGEMVEEEPTILGRTRVGACGPRARGFERTTEPVVPT